MSDDEASRAADADERSPSKTRRKREMHERQDLGESLAALSPARLAALDLPERLVDAIVQVRGITRHEARRRQMQFIGRLMREVDPGPIAAALAAFDEAPRIEKARFAALEAWRDRLVADEAALADYLALHPGADAKTLRSLVQDARAERAAGRAPHRFRQLFRALKAQQDAAGTDEGDPSAGAATKDDA